ncbi:MAG: DUF72 domain-containing protein [Ignavibacteriae bacterium]|nr:DUF72 domain-containing protein [Ignavibacteriota bacterium]
MDDTHIRLGTSGWSYKDWIGSVYPDGCTAAKFLRVYAERFPTVEIDSTFYGIPRESTVEKWRAETPDDFVFAAKFPQSITHETRLQDHVDEARAFIERLRLLGPKLGPLLLQFPYGFRVDAHDELDAFLARLPDDCRIAVEVRHKSWLGDRFTEMLRARGVALALIDHPWMPVMDKATADFTYIRWLGDRKKIEDDFSHIRFERTEALLRWKNIVDRLSTEGLFIYGYFNNHYEGHSPATLARFRALLGLG